ncbi:unnamed protein product [Amoebophrya sp. A25]|nr:unnamed protein product [Amoebophrya sp. A25]|eukprot:GSA25T00019046001.1
MFHDFANFDADLGGWDVSKATSMASMFQDCDQFRGRGLERWDVSSVTDMDFMFSGNSALDAFLGRWDVSSVRSMRGVFRYATAMTGGGISAWNVANVTDMRDIFCGASSFNEPNLGKWNVAAVERVQDAFYDVPFAQPLNDWDLSKAFFGDWLDDGKKATPTRSHSAFIDVYLGLDTSRLPRSLWPRDPTKKSTEGHIAVPPVSRASASKSPPWTVESTEMLSGLAAREAPPSWLETAAPPCCCGRKAA